jgi:Family of unknown function (DUF5670)
MLYTIAVILLVAWLLAFVRIYTIGPFVHVQLVVAIVLFLVGLSPDFAEGLAATPTTDLTQRR